MLPFVGSSPQASKALLQEGRVQTDLLGQILTELKTLSVVTKEGLNVPDELQDIREDVQNEAE